jgi:hypothetical protein
MTFEKLTFEIRRTYFPTGFPFFHHNHARHSSSLFKAVIYSK